MKKIVSLLKKKLENGIFSEIDIVKILKCKVDKAHYIRFKLLKNNIISRVCKGYYRFIENKIDYPKETYLLRDKLQTLHKKFTLTGPSLFGDKHLLYVSKGTSKQFSDFLENLGYVVLINPKADNIEILINKANIQKLVVIRENNYFYSSKDCLASMEKAIVDYYFEINHNLFYEFEKLELSKLFPQLNLSTLLKCAQLRNQKQQFEKLLSKFRIPKKVKSVLNV